MVPPVSARVMTLPELPDTRNEDIVCVVPLVMLIVCAAVPMSSKVLKVLEPVMVIVAVPVPEKRRLL